MFFLSTNLIFIFFLVIWQITQKLFVMILANHHIDIIIITSFNTLPKDKNYETKSGQK